MATLTPDKIRYEHGLKICEKIIPWGAVWTKSYQSYKKGDKYKSDRYFEGNKPSYITIHNTDGNANAETYTRATYPNQNMGTVRVHYYVDDNEAWQNLREDEIGWHAGTGGLGPGNRDSIGIEIIMCGSKIKNDIQAEENGALLAAILLDRYGLGTDKLRTHKDWSGKQCPLYILPHWDSFVKSVERHLEPVSYTHLGAVGQRVEHVKVDPAAVIGNLKQQPAVIRVIKRAAHRAMLLGDDWLKAAFFEVVPKKPALHHAPKQREIVDRFCKRLLQKDRVDLLIQLAGEAEHLGIPLAGIGGKYFCGVVEPVPFYGLFIHGRMPAPF